MFNAVCVGERGREAVTAQYEITSLLVIVCACVCDCVCVHLFHILLSSVFLPLHPSFPCPGLCVFPLLLCLSLCSFISSPLL